MFEGVKGCKNIYAPRGYASVALHGPVFQINSSLARPHDLTCQVCEKHCVDEVRFFRHIHKYHPDYWRVFSGGRPLNDFIEMRDVKERDKVYTCDICHKNFSNESGYWKHMATHPGIETDQQVQLFKCLVCKKLFTKEGYLLRHMEMKLDEQHCKALVELKKNSAMFRVTQAETYLLPPMMGQVDNEPMSSDEVDAKPRLGSSDIGSSGSIQAGGGGGSAFESQDKAASSQKLMPPRAHQSSSGYPPIPLNRSLSLDHQVVPYGRSIHSPDMFEERANHRLERSESAAARNKSPPGLSRLVVCDPRDAAAAAAAHPADGATMSPKASLSGSSSPCSPMSVQSFSYHGDNQHQQHQQQQRPVTSDGRNCPTNHRTLYSPGVHVAPGYYPKSTGAGAQEMLQQGRGGYHGSSHPSFPQSPAASCLPRSPEEHQQRSPEDHKPSFSAHDYLEPASPYVQRFHALPPPPPAPALAPSMQNGGRATTSPHIMIPPGPFVYPSVMSPPYGGAGPVRQLQQDSLLRRGGEMSSSSDVVGMDVFQRHSSGGEVADRDIGTTDIYMRRTEPGGDHGADVYGLRSADATDNYLHRSDMLERDLNAYLRRNDISESEVDAFLRRNDISECYIATALSQLARSIPGFR